MIIVFSIVPSVERGTTCCRFQVAYRLLYDCIKIGNAGCSIKPGARVSLESMIPACQNIHPDDLAL